MRLAHLLLGLVSFLGSSAWAHAEDFTDKGIERAQQATVAILDQGPEGRFGGRPRPAVRGSGFHLRDGYIVTARHTVEASHGSRSELPQRITLLTSDLVELSASLVGDSGFLDVVLYRLNREAVLPHIPLADTNAAPGQEVFTVGYPLGWGPAIEFGRVGNPNIFLPTAEMRLLQVDLAVCSGNSGGGLFNRNGELLGVMHAIIQTEQTQAERRCSRLAFAVPSGVFHRVLQGVLAGEQPRFSRLGVQMGATKIGLRWRVIAEDVTGSALAGGVQKGDVLLAIDGTEIKDAAQLKNYLIEHTQPGQQVTLRIRRNEHEFDLSVTLGGSRP